MFKKRAKGLPSSFENRKKVFKKMEAKKSLSLESDFELFNRPLSAYNTWIRWRRQR